MMKAHSLSYEEIGERNGWSYTKVNRAITEGRGASWPCSRESSQAKSASGPRRSSKR